MSNFHKTIGFWKSFHAKNSPSKSQDTTLLSKTKPRFKVTMTIPSTNTAVVLPNDGLSVIGRNMYGIVDRRISKEHFSISVDTKTHGVSIKNLSKVPMFYFLRSDPTFPHPIPPDTTYDLNFSIDRFAMRQNTSEKGSGYLYEFSISRGFVEDIEDLIEVKKETEDEPAKVKFEDSEGRNHSLIKQNDVVEIVDMEEDEVRMEEEAFKPSEKQNEGNSSLEGSSSIGLSSSTSSFPTEGVVDGSRKSDIAITNPTDRSIPLDNSDNEWTTSLPGSPEAMERQSRLEKPQKPLSQELGIPHSTLSDQSSAEDESTDVADSEEDVIPETQTPESEDEMGYGSEESDLWDDGFNDNVDHLYGFLLDQNHSTSHSDSSTSSPVKKRRLAQDRSATIEPLKAKIEVTSSTDSGAETDIGEDEPVVGEKDAENDMDKTSSRQVKNQKDVKGRAIPARRKGGK